MSGRDFRSGNNPRTLDSAITTTAKTLTLSMVPDALAFYADAVIKAPATNTDTIYFRINGAVADATNGEALAPGEERHVEAFIRSISAIAASGTQAIEVAGRG